MKQRIWVIAFFLCISTYVAGENPKPANSWKEKYQSETPSVSRAWYVLKQINTLGKIFYKMN